LSFVLSFLASRVGGVGLGRWSPLAVVAVGIAWVEIVDTIICKNSKRYMLSLDAFLDAKKLHFAMKAILFLLLLSLVVPWVRGLSLPSPQHRGSKKTDSGRASRDCVEGSNNEKTVVLLFNKPANVITSHVSEDSRSTVYDEVQSMKGFIRHEHKAGDQNDRPLASFEKVTGIRSKLHAIGRLDADTTGLLLLTNDGGLVHHVTNRNAPTHQEITASIGPITKTYEALIMGHHDDTSLAPLWEGVDIGAKYGGMTRPVDNLEVLDHPNHKSTLVSLTISEGKNRQVRRMFHSLGSGVMKLTRTKIGEHLTLDGVEENMWRILSEEEIRNSLGWEIKDLDQARADPTRQKVFPRQTAAKRNSNR
jgi:pseudouridine synthase